MLDDVPKFATLIHQQTHISLQIRAQKMLKLVYFVLTSSLLSCGVVQTTDSDDWQPIFDPDIYDGVKTVHSVQPSSFNNIVNHGFHQQHQPPANDECGLYKVAFTQDLYFQYIQYKTRLPELKEFTLCFWSKFYNHSNDHPVFSYAVDGQPKAISSWISNTERSSYFSLAVEGHTFYRLNYPFRLNKWYHTCQSWNGKTGEWQIWVNAERVGRGFHNRLVGHVVPSGGLAVTGQEQTQLGGGFLEGKEAPKGSGGMIGEVTMVQLYSVALTAGKAHKDHKHHHAHQYDHNGNQITTPPPTSPRPRAALPTHPLLTNGQINPSLMLNFAGGQPQQAQVVQGQDFNAQYLNGQFVNSIVAQQFAAGRGPQQFQPRAPAQQLQLLNPEPRQPAASPLINSGLVHSSLSNPANVQFIDTQLETHQLFKRQNKGEADEPQYGDRIAKKGKRQSEERIKFVPTAENKHAKRGIYVGGGTIIDESNFDSYFDGLAEIGDNQPVIQVQKDNDDREPAEAEVKAVMNICSGCDEEPFEKALIFGWRTVAKKLFSGAYYAPATPQCKVF